MRFGATEAVNRTAKDAKDAKNAKESKAQGIACSWRARKVQADTFSEMTENAEDANPR